MARSDLPFKIDKAIDTSHVTDEEMKAARASQALTKGGVPVELVGHVKDLLGEQAPGEAQNLPKPCNLLLFSRRSSDQYQVINN